MTNTVLGKVSCTPKGAYDSGTLYNILDIVAYDGGSYMALNNVSGVLPNNDGENWLQLAAKGDTGATGSVGATGAAAGFGTPTATIDGNVGIPSVKVEASGPDTEKIFAFSFSGLKGETGATGEKGDVGDTGATGPAGVSVVNAEINESGHLIITLSEGEPVDAGNAVGQTGEQGPAGQTGEAGASVDHIQRTTGTGAPGTTDTYTVYLTDGSEAGTFDVYNGANGTGTGDFMASGIVPMTGNLQMGGNRVINVAEPVDEFDAVRKSDLQNVADNVNAIISGEQEISLPTATKTTLGVVIVGDGLSVAESGNLSIVSDDTPTEGSINAVKSGGVYSALAGKQDLLIGTAGQVVGFDDEGNAIAQAAPETGVTSFNGRSGLVIPQTGDYTAAMVGARPDTWTPDAAEIGAQPEISASGLLKGDGSGNVTAAEAGTDYQAPITANGLLKGDGSGAIAAAAAGTDYFAPGGADIPIADGGTGASSADAARNNLNAQQKITATGLLKADGDGNVSSAAAGTDYQAPITASGILKGNGSGGITAAAAGTDYLAPGMIIPISGGGTGVSSMTGTDYTANRPRGIILRSSTPSSVENGCIVGVYEA